jgi:RNA polymerase sigma-70 factor (ECF subfamily)
LDENSFTSEMMQCTQMFYRIAFTILRNREDCLDAMQETAFRAWKKLGSLRNERYFRTWATRILINECKTILRKRRRNIPLEDIQEIATEPPDPTLALMLHDLPEHLRLPLVMFYLEGMTEKEVAYALRLPQTTVRGRIARAKARLRKELEEL